MSATGPTGTQGVVFDLDTFAVHDGPGIRLTVYLKGCPLRCAWCHSPESQGRARELLLVREHCVACGACAAACPEGVHRLADGRHVLDRARCRACGRCVASCPAQALRIAGQMLSADEVLARARRLHPFFRHSGGGVTLTGGEVTLQADYAAAILAGCRAEGIHTAFETCGACDWPTLERLARHSDLILYDLKLMDDATHRRWVGGSNRQILENAARLADYPVQVQVRVPLIPGITDTPANLRAVCAFMRDAGLGHLALLPYNEAAAAKYAWLDRRYPLDGARQSRAQLDAALALARDLGIAAEIG